MALLVASHTGRINPFAKEEAEKFLFFLDVQMYD